MRRKETLAAKNQKLPKLAERKIRWAPNQNENCFSLWNAFLLRLQLNKNIADILNKNNLFWNWQPTLRLWIQLHICCI
jgi:hypothetical protein